MYSGSGAAAGNGAFAAGPGGVGMASASASTGPAVSITQISPDQESISFTLSGVDMSVANSLRRVMIAEVPTLTIDLVEFAENSVGAPLLPRPGFATAPCCCCLSLCSE
jgi:hypothetical protein